MKRSFVVRVPLALFALLLCTLVPTSSARALSFGPHLDYATEANPVAVAVGDLNEDGKKDIVALGFVYHASVMLGDGAGGFGGWTNFAVGGSPGAITLGDLNGDGHQDLIATTRNGNYVTIYYGDGTGWLNDRNDWTWNDGLSDGPSSVVIGDFAGDGKQDLLISNAASNTISLLVLDINDHWARTVFSTGTTPEGIAAADLDGDGNKDALTADAGADAVSVLLGDGSGGFGPKQDFATGAGPRSLALADFNGDGRKDAATANATAGTVSVLLGDGAGGFGAKSDVAMGSEPRWIVVSDFNGDGRKDLATANAGADTVSVLLGDGAGGFPARADLVVGDEPWSLAVGDFLRDGKPDLVTANHDAASVSVLRNTSRPKLRSLKPMRGRVNATVTIAGWGFGPRRGASRVSFGSKVATTYVSWGAGKIRVKVPRMAAGRKSVRVTTACGRSNAKYFRLL